MLKKPLPQFNSHDEAVDYYSKYGKLEYFGHAGYKGEYCVYNYHVRDGRLLRINIYESGRVEYR